MTIGWQPHVSPVVLLALVVLATAWAVRIHARMSRRFGADAWLLLAPKLALVALVILALLDPTLTHTAPGPHRSVLLLVDQSSSMEVRDPGAGAAADTTRRERAMALARAFTPPPGMGCVTRFFDTALHDAPAPPGPGGPPRGTDIAACLQEAARGTDAGACAGIVLLSDGGDEPVHGDGLPGVPISAIGIGSDLQGAANLAIVDVTAPATAERGVGFTISVDASCAGPADFLARADACQLTLERQAPGDPAWHALAAQRVDLSHGRGRCEFPVVETGLGAQRYRLSLAGLAGEISLLDNVRTVLVDVRERSLHVLYYSRSLGIGYKPLRAELSRDAGIGFTALFQTIGGRLAQRTGVRYTVQGERSAGDDGLGAGFPATAAGLSHFDVVIIGSFPASDWTEAQAHALSEYVALGGAAVFLGGEESFGRGGYAASPLAELMPWQIRDTEPAMVRGELTLAISPQAQGHAITQGLGTAFDASAKVESVNEVGPLRAGAQAILQAEVGGDTLAVVAVQPYGKGKVMGIASDTLWRLGENAAGATFGVFWRQSVRFLADRGEGGAVLRVVWDRASYRPGDTALATVQMTASGGSCRLTASVDGPDGHQDLTPAAQSASGGSSWTLSVPFAHRGDYALRIVGYRDDALLETYQKVLEVVPSLPEGARLRLDEEGLTQLCQAHGGVYVPQDHLEGLAPWLTSISQAQQQQSRSVVFSGSGWWLAVACALLVEWILRRRRNLV